ncbi:MAG: hypothetical protein ACYS7Y_36380 [Planctomycetota bacterium]|jgi:hypothetical protein
MTLLDLIMEVEAALDEAGEHSMGYEHIELMMPDNKPVVNTYGKIEDGKCYAYLSDVPEPCNMN